MDIIRSLAEEDKRYKKEAFYYVARAVESSHDRIVSTEKNKRHITGRELIDEMICLGAEDFGFLARTVFEEWGICSTDDIGEIVFLMVEKGILSAQESDSKADFRNILSLGRVLEDYYSGFELD